METTTINLKKGLIVSCQASPGWAFYGSENMQRMALAAQQGGAVGIRACWADNIRAIKQVVNLPVVGVNKVFSSRRPTAADVTITPSFEAAAQVIEAGCDILGIDCTARGRSWEDVRRLLQDIFAAYPGIPVMADISTLEEGLMATDMGAQILSTTLSGYTSTSLGLTLEQARELTGYPDDQEPPPDLELIRQLRARTSLPINAEGRYWEVQQVRQAFDNGADYVTVGSAITAPQLITRRFVQGIRDSL